MTTTQTTDHPSRFLPPTTRLGSLALSCGLACAAWTSPALAAEPQTAETPAKQVESVEQADAYASDTLESLLGGELTKPELWIGTPAPALAISEWVKGDSVDSFRPDHVYVMEFWATWCGPCIRAMPHVSELQTKYDGKVTVIGVNVWEGREGADRSEHVRGFAERHADKMNFTVAIEDGDAMAKTWMEPAQRQGIPASFIVDGQGRVAWIGHPMELDEPLEQIVSGSYDMEAWSKKAWEAQLAMTAFQQVGEQLRTDPDRAYRLIRVLERDHIADEPMILNALSWEILTGEGIEQRDLKLARRLAKAAADKTAWNEFSILDTYARAASMMGDHAEAVKWQTKAVELAPDEAKADLQESLDEYTEAAGG